MVESFFGKAAGPSPEDFANRLWAIALDANLHSRFYDLLRMTEAQRKRYLFSTVVFTASVPFAMALCTMRRDLEAFLPQAYTKMVAPRETYYDGVVRLGDYIITEYEYAHLPAALEAFVHVRVPSQGIQDRQVRYSHLHLASIMVRGSRQFDDFREAAKYDPEGQDTDKVLGVCGVRLLTYIYTRECISAWSGQEEVRYKQIFASLALQIPQRVLPVFSAL
jgi:hypothetical protein